MDQATFSVPFAHHRAPKNRQRLLAVGRFITWTKGHWEVVFGGEMSAWFIPLSTPRPADFPEETLLGQFFRLQQPQSCMLSWGWDSGRQVAWSTVSLLVVVCNLFLKGFPILGQNLPHLQSLAAIFQGVSMEAVFHVPFSFSNRVTTDRGIFPQSDSGLP